MFKLTNQRSTGRHHRNPLGEENQKTNNDNHINAVQHNLLARLSWQPKVGQRHQNHHQSRCQDDRLVHWRSTWEINIVINIDIRLIAAFVFPNVSLRIDLCDDPFVVLIVQIPFDAIFHQINLICVVRPGSDFQIAFVRIVWPVSHIHFAVTAEQRWRHPENRSVFIHQTVSVPEVLHANASCTIVQHNVRLPNFMVANMQNAQVAIVCWIPDQFRVVPLLYMYKYFVYKYILKIQL